MMSHYIDPTPGEAAVNTGTTRQPRPQSLLIKGM